MPLKFPQPRGTPTTVKFRSASEDDGRASQEKLVLRLSIWIDNKTQAIIHRLPALKYAVEHKNYPDATKTFAVMDVYPADFADWQIADLRPALERLYDVCILQDLYIKTTGFMAVQDGSDLDPEFSITVDASRSYPEELKPNPFAKKPGRLLEMKAKVPTPT